MFSVFYSKQAEKFIENAEKSVIKRILKKIEEPSIDPVKQDSKAIHGYKDKLFRIRVGNYRILYELDY